MKKTQLLWIVIIGSIVFTSCNTSSSTGTMPETTIASEKEIPPAPTNIIPPADQPKDLLLPEDLTYLGAFRLPARSEGADDSRGWEYGGQALTFYPEGDPNGGADGFPGSLIGSGHEVWNYASEVSIPVPVNSKNVADLPVAEMLQDFEDISGGFFDPLIEMPRVALEYMPAQPGEKSDHLYLAWGAHFQEDAAQMIPSHARSGLDLGDPQVEGAWWVDDYSLYSVNGYLFEIPANFADSHLNGKRLGTGRYRDGGWSGMGPDLIAIAPWQAGDPPSKGTHLEASTLLLYSNTRGEDATSNTLNSYQHSDEWEDGAWLTAGDRSAVIFVGSKGSGYLWYGFFSPNGDGMPCVEQDLTMVGCFNPDGSPCDASLNGYCEGNSPDSRGWWSSRWDSQILFYNPADLAAVANGDMQPGEPQPYAVLDIDDTLLLDGSVEPIMLGSGEQRRYRLGEIAFDQENGYLYILEKFADGAMPVVHVWQVK
jgi:hypothetical protein